MSEDQFCTHLPTLTAPPEDAEPVEPDAEATFRMTRAFYVGTPGDLVVRMKSGRTVTWKDAQGLMPMRADQLLPGTTAQDVLACR